jgi:hypothetical protein
MAEAEYRAVGARPGGMLPPADDSISERLDQR